MEKGSAFPKGTYTCYMATSKKEIELLNSVLKGIDLSKEVEKEEFINIMERICKLELNLQVHIIHCILDTMYDISVEDTILNKNIETLFKGDAKFNAHKDIILASIEDLSKEELEAVEKKYSIKIKYSGK